VKLPKASGSLSRNEHSADDSDRFKYLRLVRVPNTPPLERVTLPFDIPTKYELHDKFKYCNLVKLLKATGATPMFLQYDKFKYCRLVRFFKYFDTPLT